VIHKKVDSHEHAREEIHAFIRTHPSLRVLLKRGEFGSTMFYRNQEDQIAEVHKDAYDFKDFPELKLVDTTGAGDCFTGAFAVKMLEGSNYEDALSFANKVGFLCITKFGAGPAIPYLDDVKKVFGDKQ
jgi:sugar/nucleoside kinase (ribokinase family)